jgi:hypothetical protein
MARPSDWISETRQRYVTALIEARDAGNALRAEWDAGNYGNTLTEEDFAGANSDVTLAEMTAVIGPTLDGLNDFFQAGHGSNLYAARV